ncbi:hypothetical protein BKI52_11485 [marine bacterium AO1-C]|nr:hypothetical protein BKI52_11485 [marine bacterium AO1-C]
MNRISLIKQEGALKSCFPNSRIMRKGEKELVWIHTLHPTPLSNYYKVKLHYKKGGGVSVYIVEPYPLPLAKGEVTLPHVYSVDEQRLCLYYPKSNEWNLSKFFVKTLIPWTSEWLVHYELWLKNGEWLGGGIHPSTNK